MACCRPKTWSIALAPVLTGLSIALATKGSLNWPVVVATLLISVLMQAISNMENDAGYTKRKAENNKRKGLPRATANGWLSVQAVESAIKLLGLIAALDTAFLIYHGGWVMLLICISSIVAAYCYMGGPRPIAYTPFGEVVVFLFFGLVAVCGTYYLQTLSVNLTSILCAASVGFIAAAVLAVNNYRDLEHDASVGRNTLAVYLGKKGMEKLFYVLITIPYILLLLIILCYNEFWPLALTLVTLPKALSTGKKLPTKEGTELNAVMFDTIQLELQFSLCITLGGVLTYLLLWTH